MSEAQIQAIKDVIKMTPRLNIDCLNSVKVLMEKAIDYELLRLDLKHLNLLKSRTNIKG